MSILVLKNFKQHPWEQKLQKICVGVLSAICVSIVTANMVPWGHNLPTEWNFKYGQSYIRDSFEFAIKSCKDDEECKLMLDQYNFNGTVIT